MAKSVIAKVKKITTLTSSGKDESRVLTSFLIVGIEFMLFKGLSILNVLRLFKFNVPMKSSIRPDTAMMKSNMFHLFLM